MDTETKIDKWFMGKMGFFIQIITITVALTLSYAATRAEIAATQTEVALIKKDIQTINDNHLTHMQAAITELKETQKGMGDKLEEIYILIKSTH